MENETEVMPHKIFGDANVFTVPYDRRSNKQHDASSDPVPKPAAGSGAHAKTRALGWEKKKDGTGEGLGALQGTFPTLSPPLPNFASGGGSSRQRVQAEEVAPEPHAHRRRGRRERTRRC